MRARSSARRSDCTARDVASNSASVNRAFRAAAHEHRPLPCGLVRFRARHSRMRWKLFRRRLSVSAPRVIVTRHLPWPLRWAVIALVFGFSAAIGLWAFEFGKDIAGLERDAKEELLRLRVEVEQLREDRDKSQSVANTAESLLKAERVAQERLVQQLKH